ncbi:TPA: IS110 family transposase [Escherichia coli]|nr:IS110 family transposase [Escherichia coli]
MALPLRGWRFSCQWTYYPPPKWFQAAGSEVAVVNPKQTRDFAHVMGYQAKTDRIDAECLLQVSRRR